MDVILPRLRQYSMPYVCLALLSYYEFQQLFITYTKGTNNRILPKPDKWFNLEYDFISVFRRSEGLVDGERRFVERASTRFY